MSFKDQIEKISSQILEIEAKINLASAQILDLRNARDQIISDYLSEEKLLNGTKWEFSLDGTGGAYLTLESKDHHSILSLKELLLNNGNYWIDLGDRIHLDINDKSISLSFKESKQVIPFVKTNGLIINGSGIRDKLYKLKRDVAALEAICHQFEI